MEEIEIFKNGNVIKLYENIYNENFVKFMNKSIDFMGTGNRVLIDESFSTGKQMSRIIFEGNNNILFLRGSVENTAIRFQGSDSLIYLSKAHPHPYKKCNFYVGNESVIYVGEKLNINPVDIKRFIAFEHQNIIIGLDCIMSNNLVLRTNDGHIIYNMETKKRTNFSGSIWIGDHVWIARGVTINKNVRIGSGSVVAGGGMAGNKTFSSNSIIAGVPCEVVKKGIIMDKRTTTQFTPEDTEKYASCDHDKWVYEVDDTTINMIEVDNLLKNERTADGKLKVVTEYIEKNKEKNRFSIL